MKTNLLASDSVHGTLPLRRHWRRLPGETYCDEIEASSRFADWKISRLEKFRTLGRYIEVFENCVLYILRSESI